MVRVNRKLVFGLVALGLVVGALGAGLATQRYTAQSVLIVAGNQALAQDVALPAEALGQQGAVRAEIALLRSEAVAGRVVQQLGAPALFPELAQRRLFGLLGPRTAQLQIQQATSRVAAAIEVAPVPGSGLLRVSFAHPDRATALRALRAVIEAYLDLRRTLAVTSSGQVVRDRDGVSTQLADLDGQIQKVRDDYQVIDIVQDISGAVNRLDSLLQRENAVRERQQVVTAELAATSRQLGMEPERVLAEVERTSAGADQARSAVLALKLEREHMMAQYANNPGLAELDRKIAMLEAQAAQASKPAVSANKEVRNPALDVLRNRVAALQIEAAGQHQQLDELGYQYQRAVARVASLREAEARLHDLQYQRDVAEAVGRQFSVRAANVKVEDTLAQARQGNVQVIQAAQTQPDPSSDWAWWMFGAPAAGLVLAGIGFLLAMRLRPDYVVARQAERGLGLPALAEFTGSGHEALEQPGGRRQMAQLAAWLAETRMDGRPVFAVQAIATEESAAQRELLQSLAAELGRVHGLRTLVLDVDAEGVAVPLALEGPGLPSFLPEELAASSLALWDGEPDAEDDNAEGAAHPGADFTFETLANLRQSCDMVLVGAAGDASGEAARRLGKAVDAHMLVLQAEHSQADAAAQLRDGLLAAGGRMLGFVMTGRRTPGSV